MNARISLRYDSQYNWEQANPVPLRGEVCIVAPATNTSPATCKIGDGTHSFADLPWLGALSTNIADWALADEKPQYNANEIGGLTDYIHAKIQDTNTQYRLIQGRDSYQWILQAQELGASTWTTISTITIPSTEKEVATLRALVGNQSVATQIKDALDYLDLPNVEAAQGHILTNLSQENGKVSVETRPLESADIPALPISKVQQLQENLAKKQDNLVFDHTYDRNSNRVATVSTVTDAINSLGKTDSPVAGQVVSAVGQTKGIIQVRRRALQASDIPTIGQNQVSGLGEVIAAKQDKLAFENNNYDPQTNKAITQSDLTAAVAGLTSTIHFRGVVDELPTTAENGDLYLMDAKEYIYVAVDDNPHWEELGDQDSYARKGEIVDAHIAPNAAIQQSKIAGLEEALDDKADIASLGSAAYENNDFFISKEEAPGYNDILTREEASSTYETQEDFTEKINSLDAEKVAAGTGEIIDSVQETDGIVTTTKRSLTANDIPVLPQSKVENLETDLAAEATAREAVQADLNSIAPNRSACENYVIPHMQVPEWAVGLEEFIDTFQLRDKDTYFDAISNTTKTASKYCTIRYYDTLSAAATAINTENLDDGSTSTGKIKVVKFAHPNVWYLGLPSKIMLMQLLDDITLTEPVCITGSCFIDLNGHTIKATLTSTFECPLYLGTDRSNYYETCGIVLYGIKEGSGIECVADSSVEYAQGLIGYVRYLAIIGGTYNFISNEAANIEQVATMYLNANHFKSNGILSYYTSPCSLEFSHCSIKCTLSAAATFGAYALNIESSFGPSNILFTDVDISCSIVGAGSYSSSALTIYNRYFNNTYVTLNNTEISASSGYTDSVQAYYAAQIIAGYISIRNCYFHASNCALGGDWLGCFVSNSVLEGAEHGGIYASPNLTHASQDSVSLSGRFLPKIIDYDRCLGTYIQDSTLRKLNGTGSPHNNLYSCYFGYGAIVYCNNVTFDSYNGNYNRPALKQGSSMTNSTTRAYFSNCKMNDIRVDSGCEAIFGAGISDKLRTLSVSGTITNKPTEQYSCIVSHETGGLNQYLMNNILENKDSLTALSTSLNTGDLKTQSYILDTSTAAKYQFTMKDGYLYFGEVDN